MKNLENTLRKIPQVEIILQNQDISKFTPILGRGIVKKIVSKEIDLFRQNIKNLQNLNINELFSSIIQSCNIKKLEKLQRVINGTGVIGHTNLGRSPLSEKTLNTLSSQLSNYCNLEIHLPSGKRGKRGGFAEELICNLTSSEDAIIVNNNAASVFLILSQFAKGKDVIISRGELIQIGGGFRIPDIMNQTGANLVEVGTTNITELADYKNAINENTSMILSVHQSNFAIEGFSKAPALNELSTLKNSSRLFVRDLGSGNLIADSRVPKTFEPTISFELSQGADIICFSGDKMLGACQAGIIVGRKEIIQKLRKNPLLRILRVDKVTYYILQETLIQYANNEAENILLWNIIFQDKKTIVKKINILLKQITNKDNKVKLTKIPLQSAIGGGALPTFKIDSYGLHIEITGMSGKDIFNRFITEEIPITGYIVDNKYTLDFRAIFDNDIPEVINAINKITNDI